MVDRERIKWTAAECFGTHWLTAMFHLQVGDSGFWFSSGYWTCFYISIARGWLPGKMACFLLFVIFYKLHNKHARIMLYLLSIDWVNLHVFLQNLQALMNECIGHVIGKPHSPVTGLYIGKMPLCDITWVSVARSRLNGNEIIIQFP